MPIAQGDHVGLRVVDAGRTALERQPVVGQPAAVGAVHQARPGDAAADLPGETAAAQLRHRQVGEVDVPAGALVAVAVGAGLPQLTDQTGGVAGGGRVIDGGAVDERLAQGDARQAQVGGGEHRADGARVHHRIAQVGAAVDAGEHQIRRFLLEPFRHGEHHAVRRRAGHREAPLAVVVDPQRRVQGNALPHPALVVLRRHHPDFLGELRGDVLGDLQARRVDAVIIGQQNPAKRPHINPEKS